jgi:two-component system chemotaxis response regulator CheY
MRAMVVDDSRAMRSLLKGMLKSIGFEVFEAANGVEALVKLREIGVPELALFDWNMPEMDGYQLLRYVRSNASYATTKIMMVTTETEVSQITKALEAGADEYVMKPFTVEAICEKITMLGILAEKQE